MKGNIQKWTQNRIDQNNLKQCRIEERALHLLSTSKRKMIHLLSKVLNFLEKTRNEEKTSSFHVALCPWPRTAFAFVRDRSLGWSTSGLLPAGRRGCPVTRTWIQCKTIRFSELEHEVFTICLPSPLSMGRRTKATVAKKILKKRSGPIKHDAWLCKEGKITYVAF